MKKKGFDYLKGITAVDYKDHLEVVYILFNTENKKQEVVTVNLKDNNSIHTVIRLYKSADWLERELSEMFGITILGREAPRLLLEKWNGADAPLRKSFEWGKDYKRNTP
ncbi:MAG: NADH-quinone oxidoreductase subunit C [Candidatus Marsarchaeota archaeon]|jgi:NADH:ubiquinone oxidoreductase subunit C|uniref:NADH dehydrogenase I, C subunit n=1 Tax=mine drainage metagenome TaxID=410659 RepID=T1BD50_9ZZZZ|nr:NADH-quinone oxidoreductase subunit C [Candidatus Marsarchaeota archaeon]